MMENMRGTKGKNERYRNNSLRNRFAEVTQLRVVHIFYPE